MSVKYWVIIPAAGQGLRMGQALPKQYSTIQDKTIIEHTLHCLLTYNSFEKIILVLNQEDTHWSTLGIANHPKILTVHGGLERCHSVLNGLKFLEGQADINDWVLVHDAVRPFLQHSDIDKLITTVGNHPVGGILGAPIRYTVKRVKNNEINATLDRSELWQAFTPQMFRYGVLYDALQKIQEVVTDEAMAIELTGARPLMVRGREDNIKITEPDDLALAEFYLQGKKNGYSNN